TGAAIAVGASSTALYSRTSRPEPQSTSTRKASTGCCKGTSLVTRITGRPRPSTPTDSCSPVPATSGGCRPTLRKVSGDASRTCRLRSSEGSPATTGISASSGSPGFDLTWICPRPNASTGPASSNNAASNMQAHPLRLARFATTWFPVRCVARINPRTLAAVAAILQRRQQQLGQLHGVQRRALAQIVGDDPQVQATRMRRVLANPADIDRVVARSVGDRRRIAARTRFVDDLDPRRRAQQVAGAVGFQPLPGLDRHGFRMAVEHRHADHGCVHPDRIVAEDLAGLVDQLEFLAGVPAVEELAAVRD